MNRKHLVGAAAIAAGVTIGGIGGALIGTPSISSAVEGVESVESVEGAESGWGHRGPGPALGVAAEAIGISEEELRAALREGQSLADVAAANGVEAQVVVDALVAEATARIDQRVADGDLDADRAEAIKANLEERMTALVNGERPFGHHGPGRRGFGPGLAIAAETIGVSEEDLRAALADGQSVAEVAEANGVDPEAVVDALVEQARERITAFVHGER